MAIVLGWAVATALAAYYAVISTNGSYAQGLAINLLASLLLVALAPFVIDMIATRRKMCSGHSLQPLQVSSSARILPRAAGATFC
jgi:hypothetical protein